MTIQTTDTVHSLLAYSTSVCSVLDSSNSIHIIFWDMDVLFKNICIQKEREFEL